MTNTDGVIPTRGQQVRDAVEAGDVKIMDLTESDYIAYMDEVDPFYKSIGGGAHDDRQDTDLTGHDAWVEDQRETDQHDAEVRAWEAHDNAWNAPW